MSNLKKLSITTVGISLLPSLAFAKDIANLKDLISYVMDIMNSLIPLFFAFAFLSFIWGIIKYIRAGGAAKMSEARNYIIFGIIGMAVMLSVFGLAYMVKNSFFESSPCTVDVNGCNNVLNNPDFE